MTLKTQCPQCAMEIEYDYLPGEKQYNSFSPPDPPSIDIQSNCHNCDYEFTDADYERLMNIAEDEIEDRIGEQKIEQYEEDHQ